MTARTILTALLVLTTAFAGLAQGLRFRPDGTFKIAQFTDTHYIHGDARSDTAIKNIRHVMEAEQPDPVLLTGDIIYGKPAEQSYRDVLDAIAAYGVPFGVVFGNHDDEQGLDRAALLRLTQSYPLNVTRTEPGIHGFSNYALPIAGHAGPDTAAVIYCFDSNAYSQINGIKGYDYVRSDQVEWYRRTRCRIFPAGFFMSPSVYQIWLQISFSFPDWMRRTEKLCLNRLTSESLGKM